ncbi:hypothetical protein [Saccharothrix lopnurensis]|uniref:Uncharacterized protein n=1 Tax=Saccharothrix lopnurensis TaxID=1670621 RepID=A0ABW1P0N6_9PSEU
MFTAPATPRIRLLTLAGPGGGKTRPEARVANRAEPATAARHHT